MAITFTAYATNNQCYKAAKKMPSGSPAGIIVHSTGANNPNLKRYVNAPTICGENANKNYFDSATQTICPHIVIGKDKDGAVKAAKILPYNICCWGCGSGSKGSYNYSPAYIQMEICEDDLTDKEYFESAFSLAAKLCKALMKSYSTITLENIVSHKEANARGYASAHGDCDNWLTKFGHDMDWFRALVSNGGVITKSYTVTGTKTVTADKLAATKNQLTAQGFSVTAKEL
jgi:N-acetyl-anhydromuramyl-L-alanine amidase AmpD